MKWREAENTLIRKQKKEMKKKVEKVYHALLKRLPKRYHIPIKMFDTTKKLLEYQASKLGQTYGQVITYYSQYFQNPKLATYMNTKYFRNRTRPSVPFQICALSGNPILISIGRFQETNSLKVDILFVLLHEIGHNILLNGTEKNCDLFASRWMRKLKREGWRVYENK